MEAPSVCLGLVHTNAVSRRVYHYKGAGISPNVFQLGPVFAKSMGPCLGSGNLVSISQSPLRNIGTVPLL